jgi:hypothetical protein
VVGLAVAGRASGGRREVGLDREVVHDDSVGPAERGGRFLPGPAWPSTVSLPSPASQTKVSFAGAHERQVVACVPVARVVSVAADQNLNALPAGDPVVSRAAVQSG